MELDKTTIVLRQRSLADLIDLSLVVTKVHAKALLGYASLGAIPFLLINFVVLRPLTDYDSLMSVNFFSLDETPFRIRYLLYLGGFVFVQTPIAMLGVTYYLGNSLFRQPTSLRGFGSSLTKVLGPLLLILGGVRFGLLAWFVVLLRPGMIAFDPALEIFWLGMVLGGIALSIRTLRPFAPEILFLEQVPLRQRIENNDKPPSSFRTRANGLHGPLSGDILTRSMMMFIAVIMMLASMTVSELFISGIFFGVWTWEWWMDWILFPINLWLVSIWGTVFRFLSYLDCRTRLEGWELELRMRAEARRLAGAIDR